MCSLEISLRYPTVSALNFVAYFPNSSACQEGNLLLENILVIYGLS